MLIRGPGQPGAVGLHDQRHQCSCGSSHSRCLAQPGRVGTRIRPTGTHARPTRGPARTRPRASAGSAPQGSSDGSPRRQVRGQDVAVDAHHRGAVVGVSQQRRDHGHRLPGDQQAGRVQVPERMPPSARPCHANRIERRAQMLGCEVLCAQRRTVQAAEHQVSVPRVGRGHPVRRQCLARARRLGAAQHHMAKYAGYRTQTRNKVRRLINEAILREEAKFDRSSGS